MQPTSFKLESVIFNLYIFNVKPQTEKTKEVDNLIFFSQIVHLIDSIAILKVIQIVKIYIYTYKRLKQQWTVTSLSSRVKGNGMQKLFQGIIILLILPVIHRFFQLWRICIQSWSWIVQGALLETVKIWLAIHLDYYFV